MAEIMRTKMTKLVAYICATLNRASRVTSRAIAFAMVFLMLVTSVNWTTPAVEAEASEDSCKILIWSPATKYYTSENIRVKLVNLFKSAQFKEYSGISNIEVVEQVGNGRDESARNHYLDQFNDNNKLTANNFDMVVVYMPTISLGNHDMDVLKKYAEDGGRVVMQGENSWMCSVENVKMTEAAQYMGSSYKILSRSDGTAYASLDMNSDIMNNEPLKGSGKIKFMAVAQISYSGEAQAVGISNPQHYAGIVDIPTQKGRITVISDVNWWLSTSGGDYQAAVDLWARMFKNSKKNIETVENGGNPNASNELVFSAIAEGTVYDGNTHAGFTGLTAKLADTGEDVTLTNADYSVKYYSANGVLLGTTAPKDAGSYRVDISPSGDYAGQTLSINFTIAKKAITLTPNEDYYKTTGETDPKFGYTITAGSLVAGETFTGYISRVNGETAGSYDYRYLYGESGQADASLTNDPAKNYAITITKAFTIKDPVKLQVDLLGKSNTEKWMDATISLVDENGIVFAVMVRPATADATTGKTCYTLNVSHSNAPKTYKVFIDGVDTGKTIYADDENASEDGITNVTSVDYHTINYFSYDMDANEKVTPKDTASYVQYVLDSEKEINSYKGSLSGKTFDYWSETAWDGKTEGTNERYAFNTVKNTSVNLYAQFRSPKVKINGMVKETNSLYYTMSNFSILDYYEATDENGVLTEGGISLITIEVAEGTTEINVVKDSTLVDDATTTRVGNTYYISFKKNVSMAVAEQYVRSNVQIVPFKGAETSHTVKVTVSGTSSASDFVRVGTMPASASEDTSSSYTPTQIVNGGFDDRPFMTYKYNGITYTVSNYVKTLDSKTVSDIQFNGVDQGWNTTEVTVWKGNLFEWWPWGNPYVYNSNIKKGSGTKTQDPYVEMNNANPAALYQDLTTHTGDVIRWTLDHAIVSDGDAQQSLRVEIGAPKTENGNIVNASGTTVSAIDTKIVSDTLAKYEYNGVTNPEGATYGFGNDNELKYLSLSKSTQSDKWYTATGVYVIPEGQTVTRFAFVSTAPTANKGNLLDSITFSTLIGNLNAAVQANGDVKVTGYWGDSNTSKKLEIKIGTEVYGIDMSSVQQKNFTLTIPAGLMGTATSIEIYHQDYPSAKKTVQLTIAQDPEIGMVESKPYQIWTEADLKLAGDKKYSTLMQDITLTSGQWQAITLNSGCTFDGQGYTINMGTQSIK